MSRSTNDVRYDGGVRAPGAHLRVFPRGDPAARACMSPRSRGRGQAPPLRVPAEVDKNRKRRWRVAGLLAVSPGILALMAIACSGGTHTQIQPPGSTPPPGAPGGYSDQAGRLYALVSTLTSASTPAIVLEVINVRDGSIEGVWDFGAIDPTGLTVDEYGRVYVANHAAGAVEVIEPDGSFRVFPDAAPGVRALGVWTDFNGYSDVAVISDTAATLALTNIFNTTETIQLPPGGTPNAASFSVNGSLLAISRGGASPDVVVAETGGGVVSMAYRAALSSPDSCPAHADDVAYPRFGSSTPWRALDLACDRLFAGGATQSTAETITLGSATAPAVDAGERLAIDGWSNVAWVSDGDGVKSVNLSSGVVTGVPVTGTATSLALSNGTTLWVAGSQIGSNPTLTEVAAGATRPLATLSSGGDVRHLVYLDRPPRIHAPSSVDTTTCGTAQTISFHVSATDDDEDVIQLWMPWIPDNATFAGTNFFWTTHFTEPSIGSMATLRFDAISGDFLTESRVEVYVSSCPTPTPTPPPTPSPKPSARQDESGWECSVDLDARAGAFPASSGLAVTIASGLLGLFRRRRSAHA